MPKRPNRQQTIRPKFVHRGAIALIALACTGYGCSVNEHSTDSERTFREVDDAGQWAGAGVSYGPFRDGQHPDGAQPTREQIREDLLIMNRYWPMIRMYGSRGSAKTVCELIRELDLDMKLMVGAWIAAETTVGPDGAESTIADAVAANQAEVDEAVRLANAFPDVVIAINVGNETQVFWSGHRIQQDRLIAYLKDARNRTSVPVTTADDYNFWNKPEARPVAEFCDFIVLHAYAMWNGQTFDNAVEWTRQQYDDVQQRHPDKRIVLGETGWATNRLKTGEQGELIVAEANEALQAQFVEQFLDWAVPNRIPHFYFEAFDEPWKGGDDPDEVEKHWGVFFSDRTPKRAVERLQPRDVAANTGIRD